MHGDERGSIDRLRNQPGTRLLPLDEPRHKTEGALMRELVMTSEEAGKKVLTDFKAYASRALNKRGEKRANARRGTGASGGLRTATSL